MIQRRQIDVGILLMGLAFWFAANPYAGIDHDARLYVVMAYRWLTPENFASDLWFAYGSQDDWSVFSPLLASILKTFGVSHGAMIATMMQAVFFVLAAFCLGQACLRRIGGVLAALVIVSTPVLYSPNGLLYVTEGFVTARGFAIPIAMLGVAFALRQRRLLAVASCLASFCLHPIMAFAPVVLAIFLLSGRRHDVHLLGLGTMSLVLMFGAGLLGFLPVVDDVWFRYIGSAPLVFINSWPSTALASLAVPFGIVLAGALFSTHRRRRFYWLVFGIGVLSIAVSYMATVVPVQILLQAQFWRSVWFLKIVALIVVVDLTLCHVVRSRARHRQLSFLVALAWILIALVQPWISLLFVIALKYVPKEHGATLVSEIERRPVLVRGVCGLFLLLLVPHFLLALSTTGFSVGEASWQNEWVVGYFRTGGLGLSAALVWLLWRRRQVWLVFSLGLLTMGLSLYSWDLRTDGLRAKENSYRLPVIHSESNLFPRGAVVYWHRNPGQVWFALGASDYASTVQASGLIFSQERTLVLARRFQRVVVASSAPDHVPTEDMLESLAVDLISQFKLIDVHALPNYDAVVGEELNQAGLLLLCGDAELDFVVTLGYWNALDPVRLKPSLSGQSSRQHFVYDCAKVRRLVDGLVRKKI